VNPRWFSLLDMAIVGVPAILFVVWQLVSINREITRDKAANDTPEGRSPEGSGHPVREHRLDDR
jgi:hypothetical protein